MKLMGMSSFPVFGHKPKYSVMVFTLKVAKLLLFILRGPWKWNAILSHNVWDISQDQRAGLTDQPIYKEVFMFAFFLIETKSERKTSFSALFRINVSLFELSFSVNLQGTRCSLILNDWCFSWFLFFFLTQPNLVKQDLYFGMRHWNRLDTGFFWNEKMSYLQNCRSHFCLSSFFISSNLSKTVICL